jgi:hypothetical protein
VCHAGFAGGLEGSFGGSGFFGEQAVLVGGGAQGVVDFDLVEDAAGD